MSHSQSSGQPGGPPDESVSEQPRWSWPRNHKFLTALGVVGSLSLLTGVIVAVAGGGDQATTPTAAGSNPAAAPTAAPFSPAAISSPTKHSSAPKPSSRAATKIAVTPDLVSTYSGFGLQITPRFTTSATWQLQYSFNCSGFRGPPKVKVTEGGGSDSNRVLLNETVFDAAGGTEVYDDAGSHYLKVDSLCSWTVKVVDET